MGHDLVEVILEPYDRRLVLWTKDGSVYAQGDKVPTVGLASTYAVRLHGPPNAPARYLWVQNEVVTNPMAHQAIPGASVFDAWGRYLGRGGETLAEPGRGPIDGTAAVIGRRTPPNAPASPEPAPAPERLSAMKTHRFHLRRDLEVAVDLPEDFNLSDAERLSAWLRTLPLGDGAR